MSILRRALLVIIAFFSLSAVSLAAVPLRDPNPIHVPAGLSQEQVERSVKLALANRGWRTLAERDGAIEAEINVRNKHTATIRILYDTRQVSASYLSSINLDYQVKDGVAVIHRNYARWVAFVLEDAAKNMAIAQVN